MSLVLGVDAGNSKTVALVAEPGGRIIGWGRALGCADIYAAPSVAAIQHIVSTAVTEALVNASATAADLSVATFAMAGADWPEDIEELAAAMHASLPIADSAIVNDAIGALTGAVPAGPAVVVNIGTGAATGARGADGRTWHSSWWQEPQGTYELSQRTLRALTRAELEIAPRAVLAERVLAAVRMASIDELLHRFTARATRRDWSLVAPVARALLDAAAEGDPVASGIVEGHGIGLGEMAYAAAAHVGIADGPFVLAFTGGLVAAGAEPLLDAAVAEVSRRAPGVRRIDARWPPAIGALLLGLARVGATLAHVEGPIDATAPDAQTFAIDPIGS